VRFKAFNFQECYSEYGRHFERRTVPPLGARPSERPRGIFSSARDRRVYVDEWMDFTALSIGVSRCLDKIDRNV
jgi:hypothetical protein